jgi:hypothetical protein
MIPLLLGGHHTPIRRDHHRRLRPDEAHARTYQAVEHVHVLRRTTQDATLDTPWLARILCEIPRPSANEGYWATYLLENLR